MRLLEYPNVVQLKHCFYSTTEKDEVYLNLVLEYVPETIYRVLKHHSRMKQHMPVIYVQLYTYQVNPHTHQVKLCDFGSAIATSQLSHRRDGVAGCRDGESFAEGDFKLMVAAGASIALLIGLIISWRSLALIGIISGVAEVVGLFFIPESPRWLFMMSKNKEFEVSLQWIRGSSVDTSQEAADIRECTETLHQKEKVSIIQLFQKKYAYALTFQCK